MSENRSHYLHHVYNHQGPLLRCTLYTAVAPGTVGMIPTVPHFLAGTVNRTRISIEKHYSEMKKGYSLFNKMLQNCYRRVASLVLSCNRVHNYSNKSRNLMEKKKTLTHWRLKMYSCNHIKIQQLFENEYVVLQSIRTTSYCSGFDRF